MNEDSNGIPFTDCWEFVQVLSKLIVLHAVGVCVCKSHSLKINNMGIVSNKKEKVLSLKKIRIRGSKMALRGIASSTCNRNLSHSVTVVSHGLFRIRLALLYWKRKSVLSNKGIQCG